MFDISENETLDSLRKVGRKIIQDKNGFRFSLDAILISNFIEIKIDVEVADIGTGTGIIPLLIAGNKKIKKIYAIEIQEKLANIAKRNFFYNNLADKIEVLNSDINNINNNLKVDMVITNPPYVKKNEGKLSINTSIAISKYEIKLDLKGLIYNSSRILKGNGSFNVIYKTSRLNEMFFYLKENNFYIKRIRFIHTNIHTPSEIFMLEAIKNKKRQLKVLPPLYIYDNDKYTKEILEYF